MAGYFDEPYPARAALVEIEAKNITRNSTYSLKNIVRLDT